MTKTKQKYDWAKIKEDFLLSDYLEVKSFFEEQYGNYSGTMRSKSSGWVKEKRDFAKDIVEKSIKKCKETKSLELAEALENVLDELQSRLGIRVRKSLSIKELKSLWEIFMIMNDKPTKISSNNQNFRTYERPNRDALTQEEREGIYKAMLVISGDNRLSEEEQMRKMKERTRV